MVFLCIFLAAACSYDYREHRIPNVLTAAAAVWGVGWRLLDGGPPGMLSYLGEAVMVMALMYPFFKAGTIGAGDVKLFGAAAGYLPFGKVLTFLFLSLLVAAVFSLIKMWKENNFRQRINHLSEYLADAARSGCWKSYPEKEEGGQAGICLSGPILVGALLYLGGVY